MTTGGLNGRPKRGLWSRLRAAIFGEPESPWIGDSEVHLQRDSEHPLVVPADGDVFPFNVGYRMTWSARGLSQPELDNLANLYADSVRRSLFDKVWPIGRNHFPHHSAAAEQEMNEQLTDWCYVQGAVRCNVKVTVTLAERIREIQLPIWERITVLDLEHRLEQQRIQRVYDLLERWRRLISHFGDGPDVVHAAQLVDREFAAVLDGLSAERRGNSLTLIEVLSKASDAHQHVGLFEFAGAYDTALRSFERQAGLAPGSVTPNSVPAEENHTSANGR